MKSSEQQIKDAMDALYEIMRYHGSKRNVLHKMSQDPPGPEEFKRRTAERSKQRLADHMQMLNHVETVGEALQEAQLNESYVRRLERELKARPGLVDLIMIQARRWWKQVSV